MFIFPHYFKLCKDRNAVYLEPSYSSTVPVTGIQEIHELILFHKNLAKVLGYSF